MTEKDISSADKSVADLSPLQTFYNDKVIFVTGATGFLGKVLVEKLLRSCPGVKMLYLLVRPKKGKSPVERLKTLFADVLYDEVRKEDPNFADKIALVEGDAESPGLGISDADRKALIENVSVVFHVAATVRFEENIKVAMHVNVMATQEIIGLCHSMKNLAAFVHVSTAYSFCYMKNISEVVYAQSPNYERAMKLAKELTAEEAEPETASILGKWPNTYTLTKAMAENLVKKTEGHLPACIFRPAIVTSTCFEPLKGWADNLLGPTGIVVGAGCGLVRAVHCNSHVDANIVPVDLTINGILASARETSKNFRNDKKEIVVYNFVSCAENPIKYKEFMKKIHDYGIVIPSTKAIWYYSLILCGSRSLTFILCVLLHLLPALLVDIVTVFSGRKPQMTKIYTKVHKFIRTVGYFTTRQWIYETDNVRALWEKTSERDKRLFNFDVKSINWESYLMNYIKGARVYILKDDMSTLPEAKKKWNRLYWYHQIVKVIFALLVLSLFWYALRGVASMFM